MNGFRLGGWAIVAVAVGTCGADKVHAQFYGGVYSGSGQNTTSGFVAGTYFPGGYTDFSYGSSNNYGGHGYGGYGGIGGYGSYGNSSSYARGYPYGTAYSYSTGNSYRSGNAYSTGNAVSTYNRPGTSYYGVGNLGTGTSYGMAGYGYTTPAQVNPSPVYGTSTTIIPSGPTGGVMQYTANGDGYTYVPDSTYPTVIQNQPTLGLSRTYVPQSPDPVIIESRPSGIANRQNPGRTSSKLASTPNTSGMIKLSLPRTAPGTLTYSLNAHLYTIQPGYSQTFREDRPWTIEFRRDSATTDVVRQSLKAGTYSFVVGSNGWELQQTSNVSNTELPPSPLPADVPTRLPSISPAPAFDFTPTAPPTPMPPP